MADETMTAQDQVSQESETDWKAKYEAMREHSRDWEKKAKANQSAADELEKLKAAQMTEQDKANARADAAEAELAQLKAEKAKVDAIQARSDYLIKNYTIDGSGSMTHQVVDTEVDSHSFVFKNLVPLGMIGCH